MSRHESQRQTHKQLLLSLRSGAPESTKRVLIFDVNANPPQHAREPPVEVHRKRKTTRQTRRRRSEDKASGERHEALVETQAPDHAATTVPRKKGRPPQPDEA